LDSFCDMGLRRCAVVVAHPDDETLWAGGTILTNPRIEWTIITLCRAGDPDRAPRFHRAVELLAAQGAMGDLDDGPEQRPLPPSRIEYTVLALLPEHRFDLILTHNLQGEYTRHRRHEETARAVASLLAADRLFADRALSFAYEDGRGAYLPRPVAHPDVLVELPPHIWQKKYDIITSAYGFAPDSFEARTTPRREAFNKLKTHGTKQRQHHEDTRPL